VTLQSKIKEIPLKVECAIVQFLGHEDDKIIRIRMEDGRWLPIETFERRLIALGARLETSDARTVSPGPHAPIF
jgi:hypothetical protein